MRSFLTLASLVAALTSFANANTYQFRQSPILMEPGTVGAIRGPGGCPAGDGECVMAFRTIQDTSDRCYSPTTHVCVDNFLCPTTHPYRCLDACYASEFYVCHQSEYLCPTSAPNIAMIDGEQVCYDSNLYNYDGHTLTSTYAGDTAAAALHMPIKGTHQEAIPSIQFANIKVLESQPALEQPVSYPHQNLENAQFFDAE